MYVIIWKDQTLIRLIYLLKQLIQKHERLRSQRLVEYLVVEVASSDRHLYLLHEHAQLRRTRLTAVTRAAA